MEDVVEVWWAQLLQLFHPAGLDEDDNNIKFDILKDSQNRRFRMNDYAKIGECEVCDKKDVNITVHYGNMWFCDECWDKESQFNSSQVQIVSNPVPVPTTIQDKAIETAKGIDNNIQVRTDLFNAATVAIMELKQSIESNASIVNKPYAMAEALTERFNHYKQVVFELSEKIIEAGNHQKAIQVYLNTLANQLRADEREKLKIADINYKPTPPKSIKPVKTAGIKKVGRFDKAELRKYAAELGIAEFTLQAVVVSKGITVEAAANLLRRSINEAKSESN